MERHTEVQIEDSLRELARRYPADGEAVLTDFSFQWMADGHLRLLNDDDDEIYSTVVTEWVGREGDDQLSAVARTLRTVMERNAALVRGLGVLKPFSVLLLDADGETVEELFLADNETFILDSEALMSHLGEDLDAFLERLLSE